MKIDQAIETYIKLRDRKAQLKSQYDRSVAKLDENMTKIENALLKYFDQQGTDSAKSAAHGTAYITHRTNAKIEDREKFLDYVFDNDAREMLSNTVNKTTVLEYEEEHGELPPGITISRMRGVNFKAPTAKRK